MWIDSHCHICFPELKLKHEELAVQMQQFQVAGLLNVCTRLESADEIVGATLTQKNWWASVGVHPDEEDAQTPTIERLCELGKHPKVVALGETGLDYFRLEGRSVADMQWQRERFITHMAAAKQSQLPLIVHTREAAADTLTLMREYGASNGVMHCFTESWEMARACLDLGFYISFSGIVTFKNAQNVRDVMLKTPLERLLVETDSPFLAPLPHRGKMNQPAWVSHVGSFIAEQRGMTAMQLAEQTSANFFTLFSKAEKLF